MDVLNRPDVNAARTRGGAGRNPAAAWLAWALAAVIPQAPALTVNELVDCRTQVEDVYWRHRIWPESNTTPKPPLAAVLPREAIAAQVETMLGKAAALKERWHRPITSTAMQAELERMARDSQAPEVLNELFAAAGTGERAALCLALPELVDRWIEGSYAWDRRLHRDAAASATAAVAAIDDLEWEAADGAMISDRTYVRRTDLDPSPDPGWEAGKPTALDPAAWDDLTARLFPAAGSMAKARLVPWTPAGSPIDAGFKQPDGRVLEETADGFLVREVREAEADRIRVVSAHWAKEPLARWWQREAKRFAVKVPDATGIVMPLVSAPACTDGTWTPTRAGYVPSARSSHTAVWTGSEMIVWGGEDSFNRLTSTGGRYNPATDT